ncbi:MAG: 30S ribosomal protein S11 [Acidobacteriota bacterium]
MPAAKERKKKVKKHVPEGVVHVTATFNNTIITISDREGNVVCWSSSGSHGFRGSKKGTSFAAQVAAGQTARVARDHGMRQVDVRVRGPGAGREAAIRAIAQAGIQVRAIRDVTPVPHNGCRPRKRRRV